MIEIEHLIKNYGKIQAVQDISFDVKKGEILGFLGPNGAGKTTTMNILTGCLASTSGKVSVNGFDILEDPMEVKKRIGYLPEQPPLYMDMTVDEYLKFVFNLKKVRKINKKEHLDEICSLVKISDVRKRLVGNLSKGYKQRVGLAQALIGEPEVLILDEPTVGLDPSQIIEIRKLIKSLSKKHTIILSSHILSEVSAVCDRVVIINKGKIAAVDTPENLSVTMSQSSKYYITAIGNKSAVQKVISGIVGIKKCDYLKKKGEGVEFLFEMEKEMDVRRTVFFELANAGYAIIELRPLDLTLEDIFLKVVGNSSDELKGGIQ